MQDPNETAAVRRVVEDYPRAIASGDVKLWESLFWLDDPNFSIIENDRPHLLGSEYIEFISGLLRKRGEQPSNQRWYDTKIFILGADSAYSASLREELNVKKTSRVTFILQKRKGEWRIIHAHFSYVPE